MDLYRMLLVFVILGLTRAQLLQPPSKNDYLTKTINRQGGTRPTSKVDVYSALVQVNIHCRNDAYNGLVCSADYPDQCKEQWNFPNPCTQNNIDMNVTKFVHPFDKTKFLMCGQLGKLYIVQCPQYELFHEGCGQCIGEGASLTASCGEVPYPPVNNNPCTREAILANKLFFPFRGNLSRFIHCDIWGKPWERICTPGEVWSIWDNTCVLPHLLNPCNRPTTDINYLYGHPCDPAKYLTCDIQGRAHEINCARGEAFDEKTQRCREYRHFKDQILSSYCEHYVFGFRQYHGKDGVAIDSVVTGDSRGSGRAISGITGQGFQRDNKGFTIDRTIRKADGTVSVIRDSSTQGLNINLDLRGGSVDRQTDLQGQGDGTAAFDRTTQIRGGSLTGQIKTDGQGQFGGSLNVNRGSVSGGSSGTIGESSFEQGFNSGSSRNFVDIRENSLLNGPGTAEFVDIRNAGTSGNSANMIDIRGEKGIGTSGMVDIRSSGGGLDVTGGMTDIRNQRTGGIGMVDIRTGQTTGTRKMVDIRGKTTGNGMDVIGQGSDGMTDIRNQGTGANGIGMVDIRTGQTTGTRKMVDIRGKTTGNGMDVIGPGSGSMTDIRNQGTGANGIGMVDIRTGQTTGTRKMIDIRGKTTGNGMDVIGSGSGSMTDIRNQGTGANGIGMVDIRTGQTTGTRRMVDIRGTTTGNGMDVIGQGSGSMTDIRNQGTGANGIGMVDIRTGQTTGTRKMVDIRGKTTGNGMDVIGQGSGSMTDIRNQGTGGIGMVDIRTGQTTGTRKMVDIRGQTTGNGMDVIGQGSGSMTDIRNQGTGGIGMVDIRTGQTTGTRKMVDIRGQTTGNGMDVIGPGSGSMTDIRNQGTGANDIGMVDIRTGQTTGTLGAGDITGQQSSRFVDIRATRTETGISGDGIGSSGMVDIRGSDGTGTGRMVDIRGSQSNVSGTQIGTSDGRMIDIRNIGSGGDRTVDIGADKTRLSSNFLDIRKGPVDGGFVDVSGTQNAVGGGMVDIRAQGSGTNSGKMVDIRGGKASGTNSMVDIRGGSTGGGMVDIRGSKREGTGGMIDITGGSTGNGMVDVRRGSGSKTMIDIRGSRTLDGTGVDTLDPVTGQGQANWVRRGQVSSQTSNAQLTGIMNQQNQGSLTTGNRKGIGSISSFDIRNQLGLNGHAGTANVDSTRTIKTDTIRISGTTDTAGQGAQGRGTMNKLLNTWNQIIGTDSSGTRRDTLIQTGMNQAGNRFGTSNSIHPSRLRMYDYSDIPYNEPCTQKNIDEGRTHFRYRGFPHRFLQCDASGYMYAMNCTQTDWFDVYTNTCVDGPIHVDNRVQ
ncbi:uncharacterized transmembrane protein DDB_G0289901-like isoform X2 [Mercenaria mercenaria]|uniref:uncharacterized transmembrane protein DDB_G0289901-like isoform X2 n=1 Tax=Mercenaria mercenaria TaxID=6596 RepID=UPI00234E8941|nr:uncharacterized transmembrane protein DDB_G0289901-like isoform X2 [Mercenaria mercenaria]